MSDDEPTDERRDDAAPSPGSDDELSLSPDLEVVAQLLAEGQSDASAGVAVGRSAKFVQRARRGDPAFVARIREVKEARAAQAAAGLGALLEEALGAVAEASKSDANHEL